MKKRTAVSLPARLNTRLNSYTESAKASANPCSCLVGATVSAIALGSLMLVPLANAEIVYTPANRSVGKTNGGSLLPIDLNNDGIVDLSISAYNFISFSSGDHEFRALDAFGQADNQVLDGHGSNAVAGVLGQMVGSGGRGHFNHGGIMAESRHSANGFSSFNSSRGQWLNVTNRYLGIKFQIDGETHFGWARFNADAGGATLTGYAYETIPDKPIPAGVFYTPTGEADGEPQASGSPLSLGALARGKTAFSH